MWLFPTLPIKARDCELWLQLAENKCIGCGVCTTKCEFDAIHLYRDFPEASKMVPSEDKLKYILPYGAKQAIKVKFSKKGKK